MLWNDATLTAVVMLAVLLNMARGWVRPSLGFLAGGAVLVVTGVIQGDTFIQGFSNRQIITLFLLIFITAALRDQFDVMRRLDRLFASARTPRRFTFRMGLVVGGLSSVLNNTPIVALLIPYINNWGKRMGIHPSKLLIPLSFIAISGGMITLIGTSTNLVLNGFLEQNNLPLLSFGQFLVPGIAVTAAVILFFITLGPRLLPSLPEPLESWVGNAREYLVETQVSSTSRVIGKSIQEAGLRQLRGMYLLEIIRNQRVIAPVGPQEVLQAYDALVFVGQPDTIIDLLDTDNGLDLSKHHQFEHTEERALVEAVITANSDLSGQRVRESDFRERFGAGIVAIHRNGERLRGKIGDVRMQSGDLLLLSVGQSFRADQPRFKDLYVVSELRVDPPKQSGRQVWFWAGAVALVAGFAGFHWDLFTLVSLLLLWMLMIGFTRISQLKKELDLDLLFLLIGALALSEGFIHSGLADGIAGSMLRWTESWGDMGVLAGLYVTTLLLTSFVTNAAAVAIAFPIAFSLSLEGGLPPVLYYTTIGFAASCAFITPMSYQTNLMIYGPGGYRMMDFIRVGVPVTLVYSAAYAGAIWLNQWIPWINN